MVFKKFEKAAIGTARLGITTGVSGAIISKTGERHAAVKPMGGSLGTIAEFGGIAATAHLGKSILGAGKKLRIKSY